METLKSYINLTNIKKSLKVLLIICIIAIIFLWFITTSNESDGNNNKYQYLNQLDYNVILNDDGSINVTETWNIKVKNTNTLFRTFNDSYRYGDITDVKVKDLKENKELTPIFEWQYHAPKDSYYATTYRGNFEIGWGIGCDNKSETKKYEITYKVSDVITKYRDCDEFYWQFLAKGQNAVPAKSVTGTITLPKKVSNIQNLKIWAHGAVNGKIDKKDEKTVTFNIKNLSPAAMIEVRVVTNEETFSQISQSKIEDYGYYERILAEEQNWANEANDDIKTKRYLLLSFAIIECIFIILIIVKTLKLNKITGEEKLKEKDLKYYRDIPRENNSTPTEALYLSEYSKELISPIQIQSNAVASTILDLCLKKKIKLTRDSNNKTLVEIIGDTKGLKNDELAIYKLLEDAGKGKKQFNIEKLKEYAKKEYYKYSNYINKLVNSARNQLYELKLIDKAKEKLYEKGKRAETEYSAIKNLYLFFIVLHIIANIIPIFKIKLTYFIGYGMSSTIRYILILVTPLILIKLYSLSKMQKYFYRITVLTQSGNEEKRQWLALKNYLNDYSLLKEKDVPDLVIWEKYLVYATAFGIADKVIQSLKAKYPEVFIKENWDDEKMADKYPVIKFAYDPYFDNSDYKSIDYSPISDIRSTTNTAYRTSIAEIAAHTSSSGSGGGGGFSGGGGGRRWPVAGMGGR